MVVHLLTNISETRIERTRNSPCKPLAGRAKQIPYMSLGDDAFPLKPYLMKPCPEVIKLEFHCLAQARY